MVDTEILASLSRTFSRTKLDFQDHISGAEKKMN